METVTRQNDASAESSQVASKESLYRTRWLMAHNRLHAVAHRREVSVEDTWSGYLKDLETAEAVAKTPA
jgi:hypothetical protein